MSNALLTELESVRDRMGRYDFYRALFRGGINPDELRGLGPDCKLSVPLAERVRAFLDSAS